MTEYDAFTWTLVRRSPSLTEVDLSQYILIDRLVINIETAPGGDRRAVAALKGTVEEARDVALHLWTREDEKRGLVLDGGVSASRVAVDLDGLAEKYGYWQEVTPPLETILRWALAGVPL